MKVIRIADPDQIRPLHVVLVCLVVATLAGSCLLTCGPHTEVLHDGAVEWGADSVLRAMVDVLNLGYAQTTAKGVAIKWLVLAGGAAAAMLAVGVALGVRPRSGDEATGDEVESPAEQSSDAEAAEARSKVHVLPLLAAEFLVLAFGLWSFATVLWARAPQFAFGGAVLLGICLVWAFALALGLNRIAARACAVGLVMVLTVTAAVAIWYHGERNPILRASYPLGNPLFLAACLIPGVLLALGSAIGVARSLARGRVALRVALIILALVAAAVMLYAFYLTRSRGPAVGLLAGAAAMVLLALKGRARAALGLVMVVGLVVVLWLQFAQRHEYSSTGRGATTRLRLLTWGYAIDLAVQAPLIGAGQGTYVLEADALAAGDDVLTDPLALDSRIAHAHNEWLEVWCDLGSIGLVLVVAGLSFTLYAGSKVLGAISDPSRRWMLIGLLGSLVGLIVEELFDVGLRVAGLPAVFYTVLGLTWAMTGSTRPRWMARLETTRWARLPVFLVAVVLAGGAMYYGVRDFRGARALYESPVAGQRLEWAEALSLADRARTHRLSPQRRLEATDLFCAICLEAASHYQSEALRLTGQANQEALSDEQRDRYQSLADANRRVSTEYIRRGLTILADLLKRSPSSWNSGLWEQGFYVLLATFDQLEGNGQEAAANTQAAVAALERELKRRPFDPNLVLTYVSVAGPQLEILPLFEVLARPLRYKRLPARGYLGYLRQLDQSPEFARASAPLYQATLDATPEVPVSKWSNPWAPETLRLAAYVLAARGMYAEAAQQTGRAAELYSVLPKDTALGAASCYEELGEFQFMATPDDPARAIATARRAIELAPDSEKGRLLGRTVQNRIATYLLASGDEAAARQLLTELQSDLTPEVLAAELGARYSTLAHSAIRQEDAPLPLRFGAWVERALQLNPQYELGFEMPEIVYLLEMAYQAGANPAVLLDFVSAILRQQPGNQVFIELRAYFSGQPIPPRPASDNGLEGPPAPPPSL